METENTEFGGIENTLLFSTVRQNQLLEESGKKKLGVYLFRVYILALVAMTVGLYIYVLVENIRYGNEAIITKTALVSVAVLIESFIFILTAFNLWVKFFCKIFRTEPKEIREKEIPPELKETAPEDELYIYAGSVRIIGQKGNILIPFSNLLKVEYKRIGKTYCMTFHTSSYLHHSTFPVKQIPINKIKELIPCPILPFDAEKVQGKKKREHPEWLNAQTLGGLAMALFAVGMGTAVVVLHFLVEERVPLFLGGFFILCGLLVCCAVLGHGKAWCNKVAVPILFGLTFAVLTVGFFPAMYVELGLNTVREVMMHEPYTVCFFGLTGIGLYLIYAAIANAVKLNRKK